MFDLAIKSNYVVTPGLVRKGVVLIKDGKIEDVVAGLPEGAGGNITDTGDQLLMPGVIDPHVHINEPGRTEWESFESATRAAIAGGVATLVDMPLNSSPVTTTADAFEKKLTAASGRIYANCGFWGGIVPGNDLEIERLVRQGVLGFKAFLTHSGIDDFPNVTEQHLRKVMPLIARHRLPLLVHCELTGDNGQVPGGDPRSYQHYLASRPPVWEDRAISLMIRLCEEYNCRVHIVHLSSAGSIDQIRLARGKGLPLTVETAPHYLYFNAAEIKDGQTQFKCAPPIREKANNELLWEALRAGILDVVATDHSPAPPPMKQTESGDFMKAWGGIASLQFSLPVLWTVAKGNGAGIHEVAKWLCEHPASLIGRSISEGKIAKGYDADPIVFNAEKVFGVREEMILHKHKITPYLKRQLYGVVEQTYLKGMKVYQSGVFTQPEGNIILHRNE